MKQISFQTVRNAGKSAWLIALALILGATFLVYFNAFSGTFQYDDYNVIVDNPRVHSLAEWLRNLGSIRPVLKLSYALNWVFGTGPWGFHFVNLTIHSANGLLAFAFLKRFTPNGKDAEWMALAAAVIFVVHPAQTEAVTYICGRSTSLFTLFYLASAVAYLQGREQGSRAWNLLSVLLFLLACLTKETALTLPFALLLWERAAKPWKGLKASLRATSAHWTLFCVICILFALLPVQRALLAASFSTRSVPMNLLNQVQAQGYLLEIWCWPAHLNIDPLLPVATRLTWAITGKAALLLSLLGLGLFSLRSRPWLGFGLLWFFLHLVPTNSFIPRLDLVNDRQLYLPSLGLAFALMGVARAGFRRFDVGDKWGTACLLLLLLPLGVRTILRNRDYRTEITLWRSSVEEAPRNPRAYNNLGYAYLLERDKEQARKAFEAALALDPAYGKARDNLETISR